MNRPRDDSQCGRILRLLEDAHGGKVSLLSILTLKIAQYSARIWQLRHEYGFRIENGCEEGRPDHTWFRLVDPASIPSPNREQSPAPAKQTVRQASLFSDDELEHTARWEDVG